MKANDCLPEHRKTDHNIYEGVHKDAELRFRTVLGDGRMRDLRPLLAKFESLIGSVSVTQRVQMLTIHVLSNRVVVPEDRSPNHEAIYRENEHLFEECRIESMVFKILTSSEWPWRAEECARAYEAYAEKKFDKQGLSLPWSLEVAVISYVAEKTATPYSNPW